jgi:arsenate reductase
MAEALLNERGTGRFKAYSAGSHPKGEVHPLALETLRRWQLSTDGLRSKSWNEFSRPDAPPMRHVITVCDNAAAEVCPVWPGHPSTDHWSIDDPAAAAGSLEDKLRAFTKAFRELESRIDAMLISAERSR